MPGFAVVVVFHVGLLMMARRLGESGVYSRAGKKSSKGT
jgi:hypothetical protein